MDTVTDAYVKQKATAAQNCWLRLCAVLRGVARGCATTQGSQDVTWVLLCEFESVQLRLHLLELGQMFGSVSGTGVPPTLPPPSGPEDCGVAISVGSGPR